MRLKTGEERVLAISDLQIPYEHPEALDFVQAVGEAIDPTEVICVGDEVDQHALSRFDPDPDSDGPGIELSTAIEHLEYWYEAFPEVKVCHSNHTQRVYKKAFHNNIPEAYLRPVNDWLEAPDGWQWEDTFEVDGVRYEHGDAQGGMYAARALAVRNRRSTVIGHHHSHATVSYVANDEEMIFGMNTGCLIDFHSLAFKYAKMSAFKPTLGCGVVLEGVPYFVPMLLDGAGNWTGEVIL
jgi:hypothetical protein